MGFKRKIKVYAIYFYSVFSVLISKLTFKHSNFINVITIRIAVIVAELVVHEIADKSSRVRTQPKRTFGVKISLYVVLVTTDRCFLWFLLYFICVYSSCYTLLF